SVHVGDEPLQVKRKFPEIPVAVCENRLDGIEQMLKTCKLDLVILDDALQHRGILPDIRLLLTPAARPFWADYLIPVGKLRDLKSRSRAADAWVITKCGLHHQERVDEARATPWAEGIQVFSSSVRYGDVQVVHAPPSAGIRKVVGIAGLADSTDFEAHLRAQYEVIEFVQFRDHHAYSLDEITRVWDRNHHFADAIITTEKDWMRFLHLQMPSHIAYGFIPIKTEMHDPHRFQDWILQKIKTHIPKDAL
ncbi:MAG: tetraacyldisaccharide 4'-kinase, partial [Flavobacteriales bacterium]